MTDESHRKAFMNRINFVRLKEEHDGVGDLLCGEEISTASGSRMARRGPAQSTREKLNLIKLVFIIILSWQYFS